jgi:hypothetical protein
MCVISKANTRETYKQKEIFKIQQQIVLLPKYFDQKVYIQQNSLHKMLALGSCKFVEFMSPFPTRFLPNARGARFVRLSKKYWRATLRCLRSLLLRLRSFNSRSRILPQSKKFLARPRDIRPNVLEFWALSEKLRATRNS